jgi:hypothetical protein
MTRKTAALALAALQALLPAAALASQREVIALTKSMTSDGAAQTLARQNGLSIMDVTWEDTGRFKGSSVGPNISDMTIQVVGDEPGRRGHLMPVIRYPNFEDKSADLPLKSFRVLVGNEKGGKLRSVKLGKVLGDLRRYLHEPGSWKGARRGLLAPRDEKVLVSAQACFLPVPKSGTAEFNPVLFNYQSYAGDPAVLTLVATREGTSVAVVENKDGRGHGTTLWFNENGKRARFTGKRLSEHKAASGEPTVSAAGQGGLNMVLLVQVPLKQKNPRRYGVMGGKGGGVAAVRGMAPAAAGSSDIEAAVIGHGAAEGPYSELGGLDIERDERYPIRVTVQYYQATSNGVASKKDMAAIAESIRRVYRASDDVGSLVVDGDTGRRTEHDGPKEEPDTWWTDFLKAHARDHAVAASSATAASAP